MVCGIVSHSVGSVITTVSQDQCKITQSYRFDRIKNDEGV